MLISLAVDHHAADVATRERYHVSPERRPRLYDRLGDDGFTELALLSTCNRTELYGWCPGADEESAIEWQKALAHRWATSSSEVPDLLGLATKRVDLQAARHAMRVAVGLESQVLGDGQILGQFRSAYHEAHSAGAIGSVLHRLFETALRAGKRVQTETGLGSGPNSVGAQAAALAARRFGNLRHTRIVVVGCGKTGERVARQLNKFGARDLVLLNRTEERAGELAVELDARSGPLDTVHAELAMADIAIVATGATSVLVKAEAIALARRNCATDGAPLLVVDLSMPRNVDPDVAALPGLTLVDLDALRPHVSATHHARSEAVPKAETIVDVELQGFADWLAAAAAREAIGPLREALISICRREIAYAAGDAVADQVVDRIASKVLALPMSAVRIALARGESVADMTQTMRSLFTRHGEQPPAWEPVAASLRS